MAESKDKEVLEVAVCAEQRSRRIGWALVLSVPTLLVGLAAWREHIEEARASPGAHE